MHEMLSFSSLTADIVKIKLQTTVLAKLLIEAHCYSSAP